MNQKANLPYEIKCPALLICGDKDRAGTCIRYTNGGLDIVSDYIFDKLVSNALSNRKPRQFIERKGYDALHLCGLDACGCVASTALGAAKRGYKVEILREGTATVFDGRKVARTMEKLRRAGVRYI